MNLHTRPDWIATLARDQWGEDPLDVRLPDDGSQAGLGMVIVIGFAAAFWFGLGVACAHLLNGS